MAVQATEAISSFRERGLSNRARTSVPPYRARRSRAPVRARIRFAFKKCHHFLYIMIILYRQWKKKANAKKNTLKIWKNGI